MSNNELKTSSEKYLLEFLEGVKRRRNEFKQDQVTFIQISGHPVAKVSWTGSAQNEELHGVMYSFIFSNKVYNLHTQDFTSYNQKYTTLAVNAFESLILNQ